MRAAMGVNRVLVTRCDNVVHYIAGSGLAKGSGSAHVTICMKTKIAIIVLAVISLALGVGLISMKQDADKQHKDDLDTIAYDSNQLIEVNGKLQDANQVILSHEKDNAALKDTNGKLSNELATTSESLSKTQDELKASQAETAKRDARITELENENTVLDKQAVDLKASIGGLETQIADTQKKLDTSEGDKAFLQKELTRLMAEKAELERQFNDLNTLRAQVKKLKEELSVSRKLEWIREGIFARNEQKGAQRLMQGAFSSDTGDTNAQATTTAAATNKIDLNVEINSDGSVKEIAPLTNSTPPPPAGK
jgi:chromosome segregation ATPase